MGLDTSHDAWHGSYSSFNNWRTWIAEQIGIPLQLMDGFYSEENNPFALLDCKYPNGDELEMRSIRRISKLFPLKWDSFKKTPLHILLYHSDCDGYINWYDCNKIAKELKVVLSKIKKDEANGWLYIATELFINGCELAYNKKEKLIFN
jgi:hypothetical protein